MDKKIEKWMFTVRETLRYRRERVEFLEKHYEENFVRIEKLMTEGWFPFWYQDKSCEIHDFYLFHPSCRASMQPEWFTLEEWGIDEIKVFDEWVDDLQNDHYILLNVNI